LVCEFCVLRYVLYGVILLCQGNAVSLYTTLLEAFRFKHDQASDTLVIKDSMQITALAVDDSSGNTSKTYLNGSLS
jgi:hypothetical protein